jgi:cysteine desulfurase
LQGNVAALYSQLDHTSSREVAIGTLQAEDPNEPIYLDYQASTPLDPLAFEAMRPWFEGSFGNPHAQEHAFGWKAHAAIAKSREQVACLVGADPEDLVFTSSASEANNLAVLGLCSAPPESSRDTVLVSAIEHPSVVQAALALRTRGYRVRELPVDRTGLVRLDILEAELQGSVCLVSIGAVNGEIGSVQDLFSIGECCRNHGVLFHTDAAQALTALHLDVRVLPVDLMTLASHKAYGPQGVGALYIASNARSRVSPLIHGGGQERGLRSGTLPTALCVGFGGACELIGQFGSAERERVAALRDQLWHHLSRSVPSIRTNGPMSTRHPGNLNVCIPGIDARELIQLLQPTIACSTGSACHSGMQTSSHVLAAIGLRQSDARASLRFGVGRFSTPAEIATAARRIASTIDTARFLSA